MPIKAALLDRHGRSVRSVTRDGHRGLLVGTFPARELQPASVPFTAPGGSREMAVNGAVGGVGSLNVWDGTGVADTGTADWSTANSSNVPTEGPAFMHSGTNGLDSGPMVDGDKLTFEPSPLVPVDATQFAALTFWINLQSAGPLADIEVRIKSNAANDSLKLFVSSFATLTVGQWVQVVIPTANLIPPADAIEVRLKAKNGSIRYWIDDVCFGSAVASGPQSFRVAMPDDREMRIDAIRLTMVDTAAAWSHNDFGARAGGLAAGLLFRHWDPTSGVTWQSQNILDNMDLFGLWDAVNVVSFFDAGQLVTFDLPLGHPISIRGQEVLDFLVRDDLSTMLRVQAQCRGGVALRWRDDVEAPGQLQAEPERLTGL